jgi:hypothetical protein
VREVVGREKEMKKERRKARKYERKEESDLKN